MHRNSGDGGWVWGKRGGCTSCTGSVSAENRLPEGQMLGCPNAIEQEADTLESFRIVQEHCRVTPNAEFANLEAALSGGLTCISQIA